MLHYPITQDKCDVSPGRPTPVILALWRQEKEMLKPAWAVSESFSQVREGRGAKMERHSKEVGREIDISDSGSGLVNVK